MAKFLGMLLLLVALPGIVPSGTAGSMQENQPPNAELQRPAQHDTDLLTAEGDLSRVDAAKQSIWIKTAEGKEMEFTYTEQTIVEGSGKSVEGLDKDGGTHVTVDYNTAAGTNHAVKIKVGPAKG